MKQSITDDINVNREKFAGLNIHGLYPTTGKLSWYLMFKALKQCHYMKLVYTLGKFAQYC